MTVQVLIAFCIWPLATLWLSRHLGCTRGVIASFVGGFLLLPSVAFQLVDGVPPVTRDAVISISCLASMFVFALKMLRQYRYHWMDLVVLGTLVAWGATNLANGIGIQQALLDWWWFAMFAAIPYFLGRCLLLRSDGLKLLAIGVVAGSLLMIPFVLFELRMSPTTHARVYGVSVGHGFEMARYGGWRPRVFQPAGLGMAIWLCASAVAAWGLWWSRAVVSVWRMPIAIVAVLAVVLGLLSRGGGAITLMAGGILLLMISYWTGWRRLVYLVPIAIAAYLVTAFVESVVPIRPFLLSIGDAIWGERAQGSLRVRFDNERFLVSAALERPLLGWGGWGDFRSNLQLARQMGVGRVLTDSLWTIVLGQRGALGVLGLYCLLIVPGVLAINASTRAGISRNGIMIVAGMAMFSWLYSFDLLLNAFATPVLGLAAGALTSFAITLRQRRPAPRTSEVLQNTVADAYSMLSKHPTRTDGDLRNAMRRSTPSPRRRVTSMGLKHQAS